MLVFLHTYHGTAAAFLTSSDNPCGQIIIHQNQAEVIDYKFGNEHISKYNEQLRNYTLMLQQMGYTVDAYVVYVALQKIAKVY